MQENLSVASGLFKIKETTEESACRIPWQVESYPKDFVRAETTGGLFDLSHYGVLKISGPDALDFLNRMSTVNFKTFTPHTALPGAFLTGKGSPISLLTFLEQENTIEMVVPHSLTEKTLEHLEKFHFGEKLQVENISSDCAIFALYRPGLKLRTQLKLDELKSEQIIFRRWIGLDWSVWKDARISEMFWVKVPRSKAAAILEEARLNPELPLLGLKVFEYLRISNGIPLLGKDLTESEIFLEGNYEEPIARNKGCYPGQEVIERIFTYGQVNKKILKVKVAHEGSAGLGVTPQKISSGGKTIGTLLSLIEDPIDPQKGIGLAMLHEEHWQNESEFSTDLGNRVSITK